MLYDLTHLDIKTTQSYRLSTTVINPGPWVTLLIYKQWRYWLKIMKIVPEGT